MSRSVGSYPGSWTIRAGVVAALLLVMANSPTPASGQGFDKQVLDQVKEPTVFVKIKAGKIVGSGTGFVIKSTGDTTLILTNRHVAVPDLADLGKGAKVELSVVFRSGTPQEQELPARVVAFDDREDHDLAMLEVKGVNRVPRPIAPEQAVAESDFFETMQVYAIGFPLGASIQEITDNRGTNPAITVTPMTISRLPRDAAGKLSVVQMSGAMIGGNSGGPIVDLKGRLIGVAVARISGENVGFAISPSIIAGFLAGDISSPVAEVLPTVGGNAQLKVAVRRIDPLGKLKSVALRFAPQATSGPIQADSRGIFPPLAGGTTVPLMLGSDSAGGVVGVPVSSPDSRKILVQFVITDVTGRMGTSKPVAVTLPDRPGPLVGLSSPPRPKTQSAWSCETNVADGVKIRNEPGVTTFEMPGGAAMVNAPQAKLFNAPCALVRLEGDFQTVVVVDADFDPGSEKVAKPDGKMFPITFQSAGLLIWQDERNFIRFERSKGSDGSLGLVSRIVVEMYKDGREVGLFYKDIPETPIALVALRKGGSVKLLLAAPNYKPVIFQEMAVDFQKEIFVGVSASNISKRPFQAKLQNFKLATGEGQDVAVKPVAMRLLVNSGIEKKPDGSWVFEGAAMKVSKTVGGPAAPQTNMGEFPGKWSDDRQLLWKAARTGEALTLEAPVELAGKYEIKAKFTLAPEYGQMKFDLDSKPLYQGKPVDLYAKEIRAAGLMPLGTMTLSKGKHLFKVTVVGKNAGSQGFQFGLDEIQLIPVR